jgi:hypothetical protein
VENLVDISEFRKGDLIFPQNSIFIIVDHYCYLVDQRVTSHRSLFSNAIFLERLNLYSIKIFLNSKIYTVNCTFVDFKKISYV